MKLKQVFAAGIVGAGLVAAGGANAAFDLSNCNGSNLACPYVTYGDGNSYSLALNMYIYGTATGTTTTGTQNPFYVPSSPGQIDSLIVNATGSSGQPVTTNFAGMDNAYPTPNGTGGAQFFTMNKSDYGLPASNSNQTLNGVTVLAPIDPTPDGFTGDSTESWDTTVAALQDFLGAGNTPIFFFNNNQTSSGSAIDQDIAVWARVTLTDSTGALPDLNLLFTNNGGVYGEPGGGIFNGNPYAFSSNATSPLAGTNLATDYVLSGGRICIQPGTPYPLFFPPDPNTGQCPANTQTINNNLGANQAAYAVVFPELNDALLAGGYDSMHVDLRFGCDPNTQNIATNCVGRTANNGYEQLFIASAASVPVPEPATLALIGLGLFGIGIARKKFHS